MNNYTMGTSYSIRCALSHVNNSPENLAILNNIAGFSLSSINRSMSTYVNNSLISMTNRSRNISCFLTKNNLYFVTYLSSKSEFIIGDLFSIDVNNLVNVWNFNKMARKQESPQLLNLCLEMIKRPCFQEHSLSANILNKSLHNRSFSLSSSAKGYAVDEIYKITRTNGYSNIFVEIGGEVRSSGLNKNIMSWKLGLIEPSEVNVCGQYMHHMYFNDTSLAVSGVYLNQSRYNGITSTHIINTESGVTTNTLVKCTCVSLPSCLVSDILGTVTVAGGVKKLYGLKLIHKTLIISVYQKADKYSTYLIKII